MEDTDIIALYLNRDERAIAETDSKYGKKLHLLSQNITKNDLDAQECVNDTYLETWNLIPPHRPERFFAFLAKITRHKSFDLCDRKNAQKRSAVMIELSSELETCIPAPLQTEDVAECRFLQAVIRRFLGSLDDDAQYIFIRRYFYGDSINTIAAAVKRSESGVTSVLHRLRQRLKKQLEKEGILP